MLRLANGKSFRLHPRQTQLGDAYSSLIYRKHVKPKGKSYPRRRKVPYIKIYTRRQGSGMFMRNVFNFYVIALLPVMFAVTSFAPEKKRLRVLRNITFLRHERWVAEEWKKKKLSMSKFGNINKFLIRATPKEPAEHILVLAFSDPNQCLTLRVRPGTTSPPDGNVPDIASRIKLMTIYQKNHLLALIYPRNAFCNSFFSFFLFCCLRHPLPF